MGGLRIGIVGTGYIAAYHARGILQTPDAALAAASGLDRKQAEEFAGRFQVPSTFDRWEDLVEAPGLDAVVIAAPNAVHAPCARAALSRDLHVLVEKPMACTLEEAAGMAELARDRKKVLQVGHMWRFDREVIYARDLVRDGRLGRVFKTKGYGIHVHWGPGGWFTDKALAGGGALVDMGVHAIDTARFILGDPVPQTVFACMGSHVKKFEVEDTASLMIRWDSGAHSIVESGWWQPHMDGPEAGTGVFGSEGYASVFPTFASLRCQGVVSKIVPAFPARKEHCEQEMYTLQMAAFVAAALGRAEQSPSIDIALGNMAILDAAYRSAASGRAETVGAGGKG